MLSHESAIERVLATAHLLNTALNIECTVINKEHNVALELPPDHLKDCFCQRIQSVTGKNNNLDHFFNRCEHLSQVEDGTSPMIYNCPFGLTNIILPAYDDGSLAVTLQIGPIITCSPDNLLFQHNVLSCGADATTLQTIEDYLDALPRGDIQFVTTIARLAKALVSDKTFALRSLESESAKQNRLSEDLTSGNLAYTVHKFVTQNFTNNEISIEMVAKHVYVHPSYVSRVFSQELGSNFRSYINNLRINLASELLANTDKSIGTICHDVGFSDHSYFNKVFKQLKGVTPSEYRNQDHASSVKKICLVEDLESSSLANQA